VSGLAALRDVAHRKLAPHTFLLRFVVTAKRTAVVTRDADYSCGVMYELI
jgi:hypothetical protein